jgi:hypothetical protein
MSFQVFGFRDRSKNPIFIGRYDKPEASAGMLIEFAKSDGIVRAVALANDGTPDLACIVTTNGVEPFAPLVPAGGYLPRRVPRDAA